MPVAPHITIRFDKDTVVDNRGSSSDQTPVVEWKLAPGHFEGHFSARIVHPRPDSETTQYERHRVNYPGQPYRIPIAVHGGASPFKFKLIGAPDGFTITQVLSDDGTRLVRGDNYAIVNSNATPPGTYNLQIQVEDQNDTIRTTEWSVEVDAADWDVLDTSRLTNGTGTIESPFNTLASISNGKPVLVLNDIEWETKVEPIDQMSKTWIAAQGTTPIMYQAASSIGNNPGTKGLWFSGFTFKIPSEYNDVNQYLRFEGMSRCVFFENIFDFDNEPYTVHSETENVAIIMWADQSLPEDDPGNGWYNVIYKNTFRNIQDRDLLLGYSMRFSLCEQNQIENYQVGANGFGHGFYFKINCSDITFRGNYSVGNECTGKMLRVDAYTGLFNMDRYDISYNSMRYYGEDESGLSYCHEFHTAGDSRYAYRNTSYSFNSAGFYLRGMGADDVVHFNANVFVSGGTNTNGIQTDQFEGTVDNTNYLAGVAGSGYLSAANYLLAPYNTNIGIRGWEIK